MNKSVAYLLGPELGWLLMFALTSFIILMSQPLPPDDHDKLLNFGWFLPIIGVLFAFVPLLWAPGSQWLWLIRITIVSLISVGLLVGYLCDAARYNDSRDSGIGTAFIVFSGLGWMVLMGMALIMAIAIMAKWPFSTVLTWTVIVIGTFILLGFLIASADPIGTNKNA